jgi:hypothetical protein
MESNLSAEDIAALNGLPTEARRLMAVSLDGIATKYIKEDTVTPPSAEGNGGTGNETRTEAELQQEMQKLMSDPAYFNPQLDKAKHGQLKQQVSALSQQIVGRRKAK